MELATFSLSAGAVRSVAEWCAHSACHTPSCLGGAPVFRAYVHHVHYTRPLFHFRPVPMELGHGRPAAHLGQSWPRSVDHVPRLSRPLAEAGAKAFHDSPVVATPTWPCLCFFRPLVRTPVPVSEYLSRMSMRVDSVRMPCLGYAHVLLARAHHAHAVLMKLSVGRTHVTLYHVCLSVPPTLCVRPAHLPCMLGITPAMHFLAANKSCHAFFLRHDCESARASLHTGPIRVYKGLTVG
ncbi:hypothetical protein PanWU01x14_021600 [Parasponia andersonii]|uniref:Uncharacterized protein n=1 Tax=Parasponia andersonii TaxID=3476 RepID=A0A2P5DY04_PARAD|nr:hypothetical protein PanWU01x14_021600 [Parasponia andersonii]